MLHQEWQTAESTPGGSPSLQGPTVILQNNVLYHKETPMEGEPITHLLVPELAQWVVMQLAHNIPLAGHLGPEKTLQRFYWLGMQSQVQHYCQACPECQLAQPKGPSGGPFQPMAIATTPFEQISIDWVGPYLKVAGARHIFRGWYIMPRTTQRQWPYIAPEPLSFAGCWPPLSHEKITCQWQAV